MPREFIFGRVVTVRAGDPAPTSPTTLVLGANCAANAAELAIARAFLTWLGQHLEDTLPEPRDGGPDPVATLRARYRTTTDALALARTTAAETPTSHPTDYPELDDLVTRQRVELDRLSEQGRLLRRYVRDLATDDQATSSHEDFTRRYRRRSADLDADLARAAASTTATATTPTTEPVTEPCLDAEPLPRELTPLPDRRVRPALELAWEDGGASVQVRLVLTDEATGLDLPVTTAEPVSLDWPAANRLVSLTRTARDDANGFPA